MILLFLASVLCKPDLYRQMLRVSDDPYSQILHLILYKSESCFVELIICGVRIRKL